MRSDIDNLVSRMTSPDFLNDTEKAAQDVAEAADLLKKFQALFNGIRGTGPFICGYSGTEPPGPGKPLPDRITVCAAYGSDYLEIYQKLV